MFYERLHAWWSIQSWLTTWLFSLIACGGSDLRLYMRVKGLMSCLWSDPPGLTVGFLELVWSSFEIISLNKR